MSYPRWHLQDTNHTVTCGRTTQQQPAWMATVLEQAAVPTPLLTYVREHPDAALHRGLLAGHEPGAVVDPEHPLQQLHKHGLPGLQGKHSTVTASPRAGLAVPSPAGTLQSLPAGLQHLLGNSLWWQDIYHGISSWMGRVGTNAGRENETGASAAESPGN